MEKKNWRGSTGSLPNPGTVYFGREVIASARVARLFGLGSGVLGSQRHAIFLEFLLYTFRRPVLVLGMFLCFIGILVMSRHVLDGGRQSGVFLS